MAKNRYNVLFYGTHETCCAKTEIITPYTEETRTLYGGERRHRGFNEGMWEIENSPDLKKTRPEQVEEEEEEMEEDEPMATSPDADQVDVTSGNSTEKSSTESSPHLEGEVGQEASSRRVGKLHFLMFS